MNIVYLDTETTSTIPGQICELSMIHEKDGVVIGAKNYFFAVKEMTQGAQDVHGLSIEKLNELSNGKTFKDVYQEILNELDGATLVAHNLPFDERFISTELWRCGVSFQATDRFDTMDYFKNILKIPAKYKKYGPYKNPKLSEVIEYFRIDTNKVSEYTAHLFNCSISDYHDSRFDTTCLFVIMNIYRELSNGVEGDWCRMFRVAG